MAKNKKPTPYIGFGNDTLEKLPPLNVNDRIKCPHCGGQHIVEGGKDRDGKETNTVLFYTCGEQVYLAGIAGRCTIGQDADVSGEI